MSFHQNRVADITRYTILNNIPIHAVVRGGGSRTYKSDVMRNHNNVGIRVYPHANAKRDPSPLPPNNLPKHQRHPTMRRKPTDTPLANAKNCRVRRYGLIAAVLTRLANIKYTARQMAR
jgi:hypothetical protein